MSEELDPDLHAENAHCAMCKAVQLIIHVAGMFGVV